MPSPARHHSCSVEIVTTTFPSCIQDNSNSPESSVDPPYGISWLRGESCSTTQEVSDDKRALWSGCEMQTAGDTLRQDGEGRDYTLSVLFLSLRTIRKWALSVSV